MADETGRRERKKMQTRAALVAAAAQLFTEKGYHRTTVADIADAADVSTRTFFLHFATKDEVLVANGAARIEAGLQVLAQRRPRERPSRLFARAVEAMIIHAAESDLPTGLAAARADVATVSPAVQARMVQQLFPAHDELIEALMDACPGEVNEVQAAALVGAAVGAVTSAALVSLRAGGTADQVHRAMITALDTALPGRGRQRSAAN